MQDISDRLAHLHDSAGPGAAPSDDVIAADLHRGRQALHRRHVRRAGVGAVGVAAAAAVVAVALTSGSGPSTGPRAESGSTTSVVPARSGHTSSPAQHDAIELVAYRGTQRPGFTVKYVPDGYVLQGVSGSTLDIADAGDHSSLDIFSGKLTVGVEAASEVGGLKSQHGSSVTVNGQPGVISTDKVTTTLVFEQGHGSGNLVTVQSWHNIQLTQDQVVSFAEGVTVTADAQRQHG